MSDLGIRNLFALLFIVSLLGFLAFPAGLPAEEAGVPPRTFTAEGIVFRLIEAVAQPVPPIVNGLADYVGKHTKVNVPSFYIAERTIRGGEFEELLGVRMHGQYKEFFFLSNYELCILLEYLNREVAPQLAQTVGPGSFAIPTLSQQLAAFMSGDEYIPGREPVKNSITPGRMSFAARYEPSFNSSGGTGDPYTCFEGNRMELLTAYDYRNIGVPSSAKAGDFSEERDHTVGDYTQRWKLLPVRPQAAGVRLCFNKEGANEK
ncbi:MAG: hypothetical protein WC712_00635 [Candidatus Brocadiia bacterium]